MFEITEEALDNGKYKVTFKKGGFLFSMLFDSKERYLKEKQHTYEWAKSDYEYPFKRLEWARENLRQIKRYDDVSNSKQRAIDSCNRIISKYEPIVSAYLTNEEK